MICRLARIKADAKRKREQREHSELMVKQESSRRLILLTDQFNEWVTNSKILDPRIELALLQNALR